MSGSKIWNGARRVLPWVFMFVGCVGVAWGLHQLIRPALPLPSMESDPIFDHREGFGLMLRQDLRDAYVVVPARPHPLPFRPQEPAYTARITKRTSFTCSTNTERFRAVGEFSSQPAPGVVRIVAVGDSITFGHGVNDDETYPHLLAQHLGPGYEVINAGVPGEDSDQALMDLTERVLPLSPHLVVLCVGVNEISSLPQRYDEDHLQLWLSEELYRKEEQELADNLRTFKEACATMGVRLVILVPPVNTFSPYPDAARFNRVVRETAHQLEVAYIDLEAAFRQVEERNGLVLLHEDDSQVVVQYHNGRPKTLLTVPVEPTREQFVSDAVYELLDSSTASMTLALDGCHPNAAGMELIAETLAPVVQQMFETETE